MKQWLENNPVGLALLGISGGLVVISLALGWAWNWPASSGGYDAGGLDKLSLDVPTLATDLRPVGEYQEVINRPVFNESRRPTIASMEENGAGDGEPVIDGGPVERPEVRLTGVVITPEARMVSLTPSKEGEALIVHEGMKLEGEYVGWSVSRIDARAVTLESRNGNTFDLDLVVHDAIIDEPPEPEPVVPPEDEAEPDLNDPATRAEEIRRRIQERREQLRLEAELEQSRANEDKDSQKTSYQDAIRSMMNRNKDNENESKEDDSE